MPPSKNWKSFVWLFKDILFIHQTSILTVNCCTTLLPSRKENYCLLPQIWMTYLLYRKLMLILLTVLFTCDANAAGWAWRIEIVQIDFLCVSIVFVHTVHSSTVLQCSYKLMNWAYNCTATGCLFGIFFRNFSNFAKSYFHQFTKIIVTYVLFKSTLCRCFKV